MTWRWLFSCALLALCVAAFGQTADESVAQEIAGLIDEGLERTAPEVRERSAGLTKEQRQELFDEHQRRVRYFPLLNVLPGVGLGSRFQGDRLGHLLLAVGDLAGAGLAVGGLIWGLSTSSIDLFGGGGSSGDPRGWGMAQIGGAVMIGTRITGIVIPFLYANRYNGRLAFALRLRE